MAEIHISTMCRQVEIVLKEYIYLKKSFHENVDKDYAEWFLQDLITNLETLIDMVKALEDDSISYSAHKKITKRMQSLKDFINEEIEMIDKLQNERLLTPIEVDLFKQIKKLRDSKFIKKMESLTR